MIILTWVGVKWCDVDGLLRFQAGREMSSRRPLFHCAVVVSAHMIFPFVATQADIASGTPSSHLASSTSLAETPLRILNNNSLKTLCALNVDSLDVAVQLLLGTLLVVTLARDAHANSVRDTLDTRLPDLLVELRV